MKFTLPIVFLTLYASSAFGQYFAAYTGDECSGNAVVHWDINCKILECKPLGSSGATRVGVWAGSITQFGQLIPNPGACAVFSAPNCHGTEVVVTSLVGLNCMALGATFSSARCNCG